jgi:hypothetical protein
MSAQTLTTPTGERARQPAAPAFIETGRGRILVALCGLLGVTLLGVYFGAPPPLPPATASVAQIADVGRRYHDGWFLFTWLQATGSLLSIVFFLALVQLSGAATRLAGILAAVGSAVLMGVVLIEGVLNLDVPQAVADGHPEVALTSYHQQGLFIHIYPLAPAPLIFLGLGAALLGSRLLPRAFGALALALGGAYLVVGLVGLFTTPVLTLVVLGLQTFWILAAAVALLAGARRPVAD